MALTELQLPAKDDFYNVLRELANDIRKSVVRWELSADFITDIDSADLDAMGVPVGDLRTHLSDFRVLLNELVTLFNNQTVTPTKDPKEVVDKLRRMNII